MELAFISGTVYSVTTDGSPIHGDMTLVRDRGTPTEPATPPAVGGMGAVQPVTDGNRSCWRGTARVRYADVDCIPTESIGFRATSYWFVPMKHALQVLDVHGIYRVGQLEAEDA